MLGLVSAFTLTLTLASLASAQNAKRGLAMADSEHTEDLTLLKGSDLTWIYDWSNSPKDYISKTGVPFYPMQWGRDGAKDFASKVKAQGAKIALGFNEPDFADQSNITATEAAQLWKKYISPLHDQGVYLVGPAVTNAPTGLPWLTKFLAACTDCHIDALGVHWYGDGIGYFYDYLWQTHGMFPDYPLWVTEFGSTSNNAATVEDFLKQTIAYMDTLDFIEKYAWFGFFRDSDTNTLEYNLLDKSGALNTAGEAYFGV